MVVAPPGSYSGVLAGGPEGGVDAGYGGMSNSGGGGGGLKKRDKKKKKKSGGDSSSDDEGPESVPLTVLGANGSENDGRIQDAAVKLAKSKYDMKNHMANERTFFKYLFTGLHIGGIGTLVLTFFANEDIHKLYLVIAIWCIAFGFMGWGLYNYYHRKALMESGHYRETQMLNPHTPALISGIFIFVIMLVLFYAMWSHQFPGKTDWHSLISLDSASAGAAVAGSKGVRKPLTDLATSAAIAATSTRPK